MSLLAIVRDQVPDDLVCIPNRHLSHIGWSSQMLGYVTISADPDDGVSRLRAQLGEGIGFSVSSWWGPKNTTIGIYNRHRGSSVALDYSSNAHDVVVAEIVSPNGAVTDIDITPMIPLICSIGKAVRRASARTVQ